MSNDFSCWEGVEGGIIEEKKFRNVNDGLHKSVTDNNLLSISFNDDNYGLLAGGDY